MDGDDDLPLAELMRRESIRNQQETLEAEEDVFPVDPAVTFSEYCNVDANVVCCELMTDTDIIDFVQASNVESDEDDSMMLEVVDACQPPPEITSHVVGLNLNTLHNALVSTEGVPPALFDYYYKIKKFLEDKYPTETCF